MTIVYSSSSYSREREREIKFLFDHMVCRSFVSSIQCIKVSDDHDHLHVLFLFITIDTEIVTPYETILSPLTTPSRLHPSESTLPIVPPFQQKLPIFPVLLLGFIQFICGLFVIILEILVFDIGVGLWCGFIYALTGISALILGKSLSFFSQTNEFSL